MFVARGAKKGYGIFVGATAVPAASVMSSQHPIAVAAHCFVISLECCHVAQAAAVDADAVAGALLRGRPSLRAAASTRGDMHCRGSALQT